MHFYGHHDIPLGTFLEHYCLRPSYICASKLCRIPILHHVRRFVHDAGCVNVVVKELDVEIPDTEGNKIVMWSWCSKCQMVSDVCALRVIMTLSDKHFKVCTAYFIISKEF
jgi:1-phosphatidylinositol-3-phosphate 5-kinase